MTYDPADTLATFAAAANVQYPLLSDPGGEYMAGLGIRNEQYEPDDRGFGIPHPGIMLLDASMTVRYKAAIKGFKQRPPFEALLEAVARTFD